MARIRGEPRQVPTSRSRAGWSCSQLFDYAWDEVGRLDRARRWDMSLPPKATDPLPSSKPAVELLYAYDASDMRVLKTAVASGDELYTAYVFDSLELRRTVWRESSVDPDLSDYDDEKFTEVPYLAAHGVRLARLSYGDDGAPGTDLHVFIELADHLGSNGIVIDKATGELVERTTYQAYGATESDYRPARWNSFREDYRFTGKEEDVEVGRTYFGKRYYAAALGRWISPDPLAVHAPGEADLNLYAYVHGAVLRAVDPLGLNDAPTVNGSPVGTPAAGVTTTTAGPVPTSAGGEQVVSSVTITQLGATPSGGGGANYNPVSFEGRIHTALFGSGPDPDPMGLPPAAKEVIAPVALFTLSLVPGLGTIEAVSDPKASKLDVAIAVAIDVVSVVPAGKIAAKLGKAASGAKKAAKVLSSAEKLAHAEKIASKVPAEYKQWSKCFQFADKFQAGLVKKGIQGTRWELGVGKGMMLWSDSLKMGLGGEGMGHAAVQVEGIIFDNMRPAGVAAEHFFEDLGGKLLYDAERAGSVSIKPNAF